MSTTTTLPEPPAAAKREMVGFDAFMSNKVNESLNVEETSRVN